MSSRKENMFKYWIAWASRALSPSPNINIVIISPNWLNGYERFWVCAFKPAFFKQIFKATLLVSKEGEERERIFSVRLAFEISTPQSDISNSNDSGVLFVAIYCRAMTLRPLVSMPVNKFDCTDVAEQLLERFLPPESPKVKSGRQTLWSTACCCKSSLYLHFFSSGLVNLSCLRSTVSSSIAAINAIWFPG